MKTALVMLLGVIPILALSFVLVSFSQTNDTLSDDSQFDESSSNESSFSSWSREFAENQTQSDAESDEDDE